MDASSKKYVAFEIMALVSIKSLKPSGKLRKKLLIQLVKKNPKLDKKTRKKTGDLIDKKLPKLDKETKEKIDHLCFVYCFVWDKKPPKPS